MAEEDFEDSLEYIYNDVLSRLNRGASLSDIDVDSLIEAYDYSYSMADDYVCSEVMTHLLSRNPKNLAMLERKAMRSLLQAEFQGARIDASKLPPHSFIRRLITTDLDWNHDDAETSYKSLLKGLKRGSIDDFGASSIIDVAISTESLPVLVGMLPQILTFIRYPKDFLSDLAYTLGDHGYDAEATAVLQELTTVEPFNIEYWTKLAQIYLNKLDRTEDAAKAIDYAVAIDPDDAAARLLVGEIALKRGDTSDCESAIEIADSLINTNQMVQDALYLKAGAYIQLDRDKEALDVLYRYVDGAPNPESVCILMLSLCDGAPDSRLVDRVKEILNNADTVDLEIAFDKAGEMLGSDQFGIMLDCLDDGILDTLPSLCPRLLYRYYEKGKYKDVVEAYAHLYAGTVNTDNGLLYAFSRARTGQLDGLTEFLGEFLAMTVSTLKNKGSNEVLLMVMSVRTADMLRHYIADCKEKGVSIDEAELDAIDPFALNP